MDNAPKPKPPAKPAAVETPLEKRKPFVPKPHLTQKPFQNRGMNDLKIRLKNR